MQITCANCGDVCEVPKEILIGLESVDQIEPYICDACENQRDLKADNNDHEMQYGTACACCEVPIVVDGWDGYTLALCRHCFEAGCDPNSTDPCKAVKRPNQVLQPTTPVAKTSKPRRSGRGG